eukprot:g3426.t1
MPLGYSCLSASINEEPTEPHYFTIEDLYPSLEYFVTCSGWIPGKFWVPTVAIPDSWSLQRTVTTSADTETGISSFLLTVYAECKDLSHHQIYQAYLRESEFELGYTAQIDDWIAACQPGVSLELEESVNFIYGATVVTVSENAYVQWEAGPNLTVTYTKPADATDAWFFVCPVNLSDDLGNCFRSSTGTRFAFTRRKSPQTLLQVSGISVSVIATVVLFIVLYRVVSSFLRKYYDDMAKEHGTIEKALQATQELSFPMVLLKARSTS